MNNEWYSQFRPRVFLLLSANYVANYVRYYSPRRKATTSAVTVSLEACIGVSGYELSVQVIRRAMQRFRAKCVLGWADSLHIGSKRQKIKITLNAKKLQKHVFTDKLAVSMCFAQFPNSFMEIFQTISCNVLDVVLKRCLINQLQFADFTLQHHCLCFLQQRRL